LEEIYSTPTMSRSEVGRLGVAKAKSRRAWCAIQPSGSSPPCEPPGTSPGLERF
jgi:hypothetical protein